MEIPLESIDAKLRYTNKDDRNDAFGGWRSSELGSLIKFSFKVPAANFTRHKSNIYLLGVVLRRLTKDTGQVKMWLVNKKNATVTIIGKRFGWVVLQTCIYFVGSNILPGHHTVSLEANNATGFLVSGIVLGPSGIRGFEGYKPDDILEIVWTLEDLEFDITWKILAKAKPYTNLTKRCNLCTTEKFFLICRPQMATLN